MSEPRPGYLLSPKAGADGSAPHRITQGRAYDSRPSWSPDGRRIAFSRDGHVWTIRPDGTGLVRVRTRLPAIRLVAWR